MQAADVKASPYEPGVYFVKDQSWQVGERYKLFRLLGTGSFSSVCLAEDTETCTQVAVKRIPDVLSSPEQVKRVLREVCILRRLSHPFIISLLDAFVKPAAQGPFKMRGGKIVYTSLDVYIVTEYADGGDLFHLRGQLSSDDVQLLMWQMLHAVKYLHANNVWHRDLKSANVLTTVQQGHRIVKVADFGSARSATQEGYADAAQVPPHESAATTSEPGGVQRVLSGKPPISPTTSRRQVKHTDSFTQLARGGGSEAMQVQASDLFVQTGTDGPHGNTGLLSPLTRIVATPCYRAPEVVMSRGGYTDSIDMWSLGCIFGELLQRVAKIGSASTPRLQVAPLFAITGRPRTPCEGETYLDGGRELPASSITRKELQALFDVMGTPHWSDVEAVQSPAWRKYLQRLPGQAPSLYRRLGSAGEPAVHLLSRLLSFDPSRRCSAEEALAHEYLTAVEAQASGNFEDALPEVEMEAAAPTGEDVANGKRSRRTSVTGLKEAVEEAEQQAAKRVKAGAGSLEGALPMAPARRTTSSTLGAEAQLSGASDAPMPQHYYEEPNPDRALAMLEGEMATITLSCSEAADRNSPGVDKLRRLLEHECEGQDLCSDYLSHQSTLTSAGSHDNLRFGASGPIPLGGVLTAWGRRDSQLGLGGDAAWQAQWTGLQEDLNAKRDLDPAEYARARLSNVADTWMGTLDPGSYLNPGRHGEWTSSSGTGPAAGPAWGVNMLPPGMDITDEHMLEVIRRQQLR